MKIFETHSLPPLQAIDFFSGAGGMSLGLALAGVKVLAGIDVDSECGLTYRANIPGADFIEADISKLRPAELEERLSVRQDDPRLILVGCSPCQNYSQIRTDKTKSIFSKFLLQHFQRFVEYFRPGFVIVENVPKFAKEAVLSDFLTVLESHGYAIAHGILNAADYGVPQNRLRYLMLASRNRHSVSLPSPSKSPRLTVLDSIGPSNGFASIPAGYRDDTHFQHTTASLTENNLLRLAMTPPDGGQRSAWAEHPRLQLDAYRNRDEIFRDSYGRMFWNKPAPTVTTKFLSISNGRFGHPTEARGISIREGATLQSFPKTFQFHSSSLHGIARQIGNAVPPELARRLGMHILLLHANGRSAAEPRKIDGRTTRARATLASVREAHRALVDRGGAPTASAILAITRGSKATVLKHLRAIRAEETEHASSSSEMRKPEAIRWNELLPVLSQLLDVAGRSTGGLTVQPTPIHGELLAQAVLLGYLDLVLTPSGASQLKHAGKVRTR